MNVPAASCGTSFFRPVCERREKAGRPNFWLWIRLPDAHISIHSCANTGSAERNSLKYRARKNFTTGPAGQPCGAMCEDFVRFLTMVLLGSADITGHDWNQFEATIRPNTNHMRRLGNHAADTRKRLRREETAGGRV